MMLSCFWSDSFWLPNNVTWEDLNNGPGKVVYAEVSDFWVIVPLVILILLLRFSCERYLFAPLGKYFEINAVKPKKAAPNIRLESEYRKSPKCTNVIALAKQLDLTERQVERWWRHRCRQDKPTTLVKFCEGMWVGSFLLFHESLGLYTMWGQEWAQDFDKCFERYPHQGYTPDIWWFYMLATAFYISLVLTQFRDVRRKDFWQVFLHHIVSICLFFFGWPSQLYRIFCLIITILHSSEIVLEFVKALKYAKFQRLVDFLLAVTVCMWVGTRLIVFPFFLLPIVYKNRALSPLIYLMNLLLLFLFVLTLIWSWLLFKAVRKAINDGGFKNDIRSSESEVDSRCTASKEERIGFGGTEPALIKMSYS